MQSSSEGSLSSSLNSTNINTVQVLVIGAGPVGLTTALWFAKQSYRVVVIEQYGEIKTSHKRAFNERHQQVGIDPKSMKFLHEVDVTVWGNIKTQGCNQNNWINIPIGRLQDIFYDEGQTYPNCTVLFNSRLESVTCYDQKQNARVTVVQDNDKVYAFTIDLIVVADGRHDDAGTAKRFFNFPTASKVNFSTYGIIGIISRENGQGLICLSSHNSDSYMSDLYSYLGPMHIRLLGSIQERYIALGSLDTQTVDAFKNLSATQIQELLKEAYNRKRDKAVGEPEVVNFSECSKSPIPIVLDYRKETIKILEGSSTIVSVEGDAARKTTFFSGSGLNSGFRGLSKLFKFCKENQNLIFSSLNNANDVLSLDQKLLEKDTAAMKISLNLLIEGSSFITQSGPTKMMVERTSSPDDVPEILHLLPAKGEVLSHIYIKGRHLIGSAFKPPVITFSWKGGQVIVDNVIAYDNSTVGVRIPKSAEGELTITLTRSDEKTVISPIKFTVIKVMDLPEITGIKEEEGFYQLEGDNFINPIYVSMIQATGASKVKGYCSSLHSLKFASPAHLTGKVQFIVSTTHGNSKPFEKEFPPS